MVLCDSDKRQAVEGITQWVPIAELRRQAADPTGSRRHSSKTGLFVAVAAVALLGAGGWLVTSILRNRSRSAAKGEPWTS